MANAKTFTYTFAAPNTTDDINSKYNYATIFNFMNMDDIVCQIPCLNNGNFGKYGKTIPLSIFSGTSITGSKLTESYKSIMKDPDGYQGNDPSNIAEFVNSLKTNILKGNRSEVYEIDMDESKWDVCVHDSDIGILPTEEAAQNIINSQIMPELEKCGLDKYCILQAQKAENDEGYEIIRWYNPAFIIKDISNILQKEKPVPKMLYDYSETVYETIVDVFNIVFGVYDGHIPMSYVVLATSADY